MKIQKVLHMLASALPLVFADEIDGMLQTRSDKQDTVPDFENFRATAKWVADQMHLPEGTEFSVQGPRTGGSSGGPPTAETTAEELCNMVRVDNAVLDLQNYAGDDSPECKIPKNQTATLFSSTGHKSMKVLPWFHLEEGAHLTISDLQIKSDTHWRLDWKAKLDATGVHFKDWTGPIWLQREESESTMTRCAITGAEGPMTSLFAITGSADKHCGFKLDTVLVMDNILKNDMKVLHRHPSDKVIKGVVMHNTYWKNTGYMDLVTLGEMTCNSPDDEEDMDQLTCTDLMGPENNKPGYRLRHTCCLKGTYTECGAKNCNKDKIIAELGFPL